MSLGWLTLLHLSAVELAALRDRGKTNNNKNSIQELCFSGLQER